MHYCPALARYALRRSSSSRFSHSLQFAPISPQPPPSTSAPSNSQQPQQQQRTTPTHLVTYASSDSNQSPPTKQETSVQAEKSEDLRAELTKKDRLIEELQKVRLYKRITATSRGSPANHFKFSLIATEQKSANTSSRIGVLPKKFVLPPEIVILH